MMSEKRRIVKASYKIHAEIAISPLSGLYDTFTGLKKQLTIYDNQLTKYYV
jgi:hypothetical protein